MQSLSANEIVKLEHDREQQEHWRGHSTLVSGYYCDSTAAASWIGRTPAQIKGAAEVATYTGGAVSVWRSAFVWLARTAAAAGVVE